MDHPDKISALLDALVTTPAISAAARPARCCRWSPCIRSPALAGTRTGAASSPVKGVRLVWKSSTSRVSGRRNTEVEVDAITLVQKHVALSAIRPSMFGKGGQAAF